MTLSVAALQKMQDMGLDLTQVIELAAVIEEGFRAPVPELSPAALRQRRHRAKKAEGVTESVTVTRNGHTDKEGPQTPKKTTPFPPLKGGTSPIEPAALALTVETPQPGKPTAESKPLSAWVSEIWEITPRTARVRTSKADIERQLRAAVKRGREPGVILAGLEAYYASPDATTQDGKFAKGTHTVIANDRWEAFVEDAAPSRSAAPAGPPEDPWPKRLLGWNASAYWHSDWGPKPGKPGCLVPAEHLQRQELAA